MIDAFIIIILVMLGCIGLGVLLGWSFWGSDAKYYKNLSEEMCKQRLNYPEMKDDTDFELKVSKDYFVSHIKPSVSVFTNKITKNKRQ